MASFKRTFGRSTSLTANEENITNAGNTSADFRYYESESLDSQVFQGAGEEILLLAFAGSTRVGRLSQNGGALGLTSSSLMFNLITFNDLLTTSEAMISRAIGLFKSGNAKAASSGTIAASSLPIKKRISRAGKFNFENQDLPSSSSGSPSIIQTFHINDDSHYRTTGVLYSDGVLALCRSFSKFDISNGEKGIQHNFELSKGSMLKFESVISYVKFLKILFYMCVVSYAKRSSLVKVVFFIFNKICNMSQTERDAFYAKHPKSLEEMIPAAVDFAGNDASFLLNDPKKLTSWAPLTGFLLEEITSMDSFFRNYYRYFAIQENYYLGDTYDSKRVLKPKSASVKKRTPLAPLNLQAAASAADMNMPSSSDLSDKPKKSQEQKQQQLKQKEQKNQKEQEMEDADDMFFPDDDEDEDDIFGNA